MIENLTSEKRSGYSAKFWIIFAICFATLACIPLLGRKISEQASNYMFIAYFILFFIVLIYSIFGAFCKTCGHKIKRGKITVSPAEAESIVEKFNIKKPLQYSAMLKSKVDWDFWFNTCKKCNYHQVIAFSPKDWD